MLSPWTLTALVSFVISFYASARSLQIGLAIEVIRRIRERRQDADVDPHAKVQVALGGDIIQLITQTLKPSRKQKPKPNGGPKRKPS